VVLAFLIPVALLVFIILWSWAIVETLRQERDYFWLILLMLAPPIGIAGYFVNFRILGDERAGLTAYRRLTHARRRIDHIARRARRDEAMVSDREEKAQLHFDLGEWNECLGELAHVLEFDPESAKAQYLAATCLVKTGRAERALPHYEFVHEHDPAFMAWRPSIDYADALSSLGRHEEAAAVLARMSRSIGIPEVIVKLARVEIALGRREAAKDRLAALVADYETGPNINHKRDAPWLVEARKLLTTL